MAIPDAEQMGYTIRRPYDRGVFNTKDYSSSQELLGDIERIWLTTLEEELEITKEELKVSWWLRRERGEPDLTHQNLVRTTRQF